MKWSVVAFPVVSLILSLPFYNAWAQEAAEPTPAPVVTSEPIKLPVATSAPAATPSPSVYKIKQIIADRNIVVVETSNAAESFAPGKLFLVTFPNDKQCSLSLQEKTGALLTLSSASCANASEITRSLPVEASLVDLPKMKTGTFENLQPRAASDDPSSERRLRADDVWSHAKVGLGLHYSTGNELRFDKVTATSASGSASGEVIYNLSSGAPGFDLSFIKMEPQGWGYNVNVLYEGQREFKSATVTVNGTTATIYSAGDSSKLSFIIAEFNAVYRWETFYMPFGLNASIPTISDDTSNINYSGSIGVYFGGGFILSDNSTVELYARSAGMNMKGASSGTTIDYDYGSLTGIGFGYKYWF